MLRPLLLAAAALTLAACSSTSGDTQTAASGAPAQDCFRNDDIFGYGVIDDHNIDVRARGRHYIFPIGTRDLDWTGHRHPLVHRWICVGNGLGVEIIGSDPQRRYPAPSRQARWAGAVGAKSRQRAMERGRPPRLLARTEAIRSLFAPGFGLIAARAPNEDSPTAGAPAHPQPSARAAVIGA